MRIKGNVVPGARIPLIVKGSRPGDGTLGVIPEGPESLDCLRAYADWMCRTLAAEIRVLDPARIRPRTKAGTPFAGTP